MDNEKELLNVIQKLLGSNKNEYELLTINQLHKETKIGKERLLQIFHSGDIKILPGTKPFKTTRKEWNHYLDTHIDILL